jgi:membrane protease YdiL (CAAX protease family)
MTIDPQQPEFAPDPPPPAALPADAAFASSPPTEPLPIQPPPFVPMPPPLPELAPPPPRKPWGFWATLGWGLLVLLGWGLAQVIVVLVMFASSGMLAKATDLSSEQQLQDFKVQAMALVFCPATIISCPVGLAAIWLFVWIRRLPVPEYLGLRRIRVKPLLISLAAMLAVLAGMEAITRVAHLNAGDQDMVQVFLQAPSRVLVWIAVVVAAPLFEELCFRGFLFRGFVAAIGPIFTILLTSAIFAALHTQYNIVGILMVFTAGLTMGCTRWRTGSTAITILQHVLMNGIAAAQVFYFSN